VRLSEARGIGGKVEKLWAATSETDTAQQQKLKEWSGSL
jgi:hypothetical protein